MKENLPQGSDVFHLPCRSGYAQAGAPTKAVVHPKNPEGYSNRYKPDFRLKFVKKYFEESIPSSVLCKECGISDGTLYNWAKAYRREGVAGLESRAGGSRKQVVPVPVREKIVDIKKANPFFGIKRISQLLKRTFFLSASPETMCSWR